MVLQEFFSGKVCISPCIVLCADSLYFLLYSDLLYSAVLFSTFAWFVTKRNCENYIYIPSVQC